MPKIGSVETTQRVDGKFNIYRYMYFLAEDTLPRWVLVGVVRKLRS